MKKRADGLYCKTMVIGGKRKFFYAHSEGEVYKRIYEFKDVIANGRLFSVVADEWFKEHIKTIEYYTVNCYKTPLKNVKDEFGAMRVTDIKPLTIQLFVNSLVKKGYARQTVKLRLIVLNMIFDYLILNNELEYNPASVIKIPKCHTPKKKINAISEEQLKLIDNNIDKPFGLLAYLLAYTGCRREEAVALRWEDIDFKNKLISINKVVIYKDNEPHIRNNTKSESGIRQIIIRDKLYRVLLPIKKNTGFIFTGSKKELLTLSELQKGWKKYCKELNTKFTILQLRHTYSTALYEAGIDAKAGITQTGHSNTSILENTYQEIRQSRYSNIADKFNDYDSINK